MYMNGFLAAYILRKHLSVAFGVALNRFWACPCSDIIVGIFYRVYNLEYSHSFISPDGYNRKLFSVLVPLWAGLNVQFMTTIVSSSLPITAP